MKEYFSHSDPFQAKDRPRDSKPGEKVDSSAEEGEERQEAEGGRHLRHQRGGLQVTYILDIPDSKPFHQSERSEKRCQEMEVGEKRSTALHDWHSPPLSGVRRFIEC